MKRASFLVSIFLVVGLIFMGCNSSDDSNVSSGSDSGTETSFNFTMTSFKSQETASSSAGAQADFTADQIMTGQLTATPSGGGTAQVFDWSIYFDETTWDVQSNKTIILAPGTYDFSLLITKGSQEYAGTAAGVSISDGTFDVPMTIRPVIGDTVTDVTLVASLADFKFQYDPAELSAASLTNPQMGIIVDGGTEEVFTINPSTGISDNYVNLPEGSHTVQLKLYEASLQVGRSITAQESVIITAGLDLAMDLVALHGETTFALTEAGGDANFQFNIPAEVVDEAGGLSNLQVLFSMVGPNNPLEEAVLSLSLDASGDYEASVTLTNKQFDDVDISLAFTDTSVPEQLGSCTIEAILDTTQRTLNCDVTLRRRAIVGGFLLNTLGINVFNEASEPIPGASVYKDGDLLGTTNSGAFGTAGYLKAYIPAGESTIRAEGLGMYGEQPVTSSALGIANVDIILNSTLDPTSSCIFIDSFTTPEPWWVRMTLVFSSSGGNASYRPIFFLDEQCTSPRHNERRERSNVADGTAVTGFGEVYNQVESTVLTRPYFTPLIEAVTTDWNLDSWEDRQDWITGVERISLNTDQGCDGSEMQNCPGAVFYQQYFIDTSVTPARLFIRENTDAYEDLSTLTEPSATAAENHLYYEWAGSGTPTGLDGEWLFYSKSGTTSGNPVSGGEPQAGTWTNMGTMDQLTTFGVGCTGTTTSPPIVCDSSTNGMELFVAPGALYIQPSGEYGPGNMGVPQGDSFTLNGNSLEYTGASGCSDYNSIIVTATRYWCFVAP